MSPASAQLSPAVPAVLWQRWLTLPLPETALLALCIGRLWLMSVPSSLWTDETATAFAARFPHDPSLAIVSPYTESIYYALPRAMDKLFGFSEIAYRVPSMLAMALALWFLARLANRLIHADAAWFAIFAFIALPPVNYFAVDAKPYALGFCIALGTLFFESRWLDSGSWRYGLLFLIFGALLWRVHQIYWPFYIVIGIYAVTRLVFRDGPVGLTRIAIVFLLLALTLLPVAIDSLRLLQEATTHVIVARPRPADLWRLLRPERDLVAIAGALAWLTSRFRRWTPPPVPRTSAILLVLSSWLITPIVTFLFSRQSAVSLFVPRYLSLHLAGVALSTTLAAAFFIPRHAWRPFTLALGTGGLLCAGTWDHTWPDHDLSRWRDAAQYVNSIPHTPDDPVICTSPFVEAAPPVWRSDYHLPGFLYSQLFAYPLRAKLYLLPFDAGVGPFRPAPEATDYMAKLMASVIPQHQRFLIYGGTGSVIDWTAWLAQRLERQRWDVHSRDFGEIRVTIFSRSTP